MKTKAALQAGSKAAAEMSEPVPDWPKPHVALQRAQPPALGQAATSVPQIASGGWQSMPFPGPAHTRLI